MPYIYQDITITDSGIGVIKIDHFDFHSESLDYNHPKIKILGDAPDKWGPVFFGGTIGELIELIKSAKALEVN